MNKRVAQIVVVTVVAILGVALLAWVLSMSIGAAGLASDDSSGAGGVPSPTTQSGPTRLPPTLAGLDMATYLVGKEAVSAVRGLHFTDLKGYPVSDAEIAAYGNDRIQAWVSWHGDARLDRLVAKMAHRITQGVTPFDPPTPVGGLDGVWMTLGNGQVHYFFAGSDAVWWISADADLAGQALDEVRKVAG